MTIRSTLAALAAVSMLAWPVQALTLDGVTIDTGTQIDVESDLSYDPFGEILDFTGLVTGTTADLTTAGLTDILGVALVDNAGGAILDAVIDDVIVFDGIGDLVLVGQIEDIAYGAGTSTGSGIQILFRTVQNTLDPIFGGFFAATITGFTGAATLAGPGELPDGTAPLQALTAINPVSADVPLPAGLPLLLGGLAGLAFIRYRGRA